MKKIWSVLLVAVLLLSGCTDTSANVDKTVKYMGTNVQLQFWGEDSETASQQVENLLKELEAEWSWNSDKSIMPYMELYGLTSDEVYYEENPETGVVMEVPGTGAAYDYTVRQYDVAEKALDVCRRTDGAYDPQLYDLLVLWGFTTGAYYVPTADAAVDASQLSRWELSSAIKGYAGYQAAQYLQALKVDAAMLNLDGVIQTYGSKPDGESWNIGIRNPRNEEETICTVVLEGTNALATTAVYQHYFEENGQVYHDVLDPFSGYPVDNGIASVTVICQDGMIADCLSEGLFVKGLEGAITHWKESSDFEMVIVMEDGTVHATQGVKLQESNAQIISR